MMLARVPAHVAGNGTRARVVAGPHLVWKHRGGGESNRIRCVRLARFVEPPGDGAALLTTQPMAVK